MTEAADFDRLRTIEMVEEHSLGSEGGPTRTTGPQRRDYAGISSDNVCENQTRRKPKVSWGRFVLPG